MLTALIVPISAGIAALYFHEARKTYGSETRYDPKIVLGDPDHVTEQRALAAATRDGNIIVDRETQAAWFAMSFAESNASTASIEQDEAGRSIIVNRDGTRDVLTLYRDVKGRFAYTRETFLSPESVVLGTPDSVKNQYVIEHHIDKAAKSMLPGA